MTYNDGYDSPSSSWRGGGPRIGPGHIPPAVKWLLIVTISATILQFTCERLGTFPVTKVLGLNPANFFAHFPLLVHQLVSYMFLHGGFMHLLFNMLFLWMFGTEFEGLWGKTRFVRFYFLCGIGGALCSLAFNYSSHATIIGASGALYGLFAAYWLHFPDRTLYLFFVLPLKVKYAIPALFVLSFVFAGEGVAHLAHLGGAAAGLVLARRGGGFSLTNRWREWTRRRRLEKFVSRQDTNRKQAEDVMRRVDTILDKINEVGLEKLSPEERRFLEEASRKMDTDNRPHTR